MWALSPMTGSLQKTQGEKERSCAEGGADWSYPVTSHAKLDQAGKNKKGVSPSCTGSTALQAVSDSYKGDRVDSYHQKLSSLPKIARKWPLGEEDGTSSSEAKGRNGTRTCSFKKANPQCAVVGISI